MEATGAKRARYASASESIYKEKRGMLSRLIFPETRNSVAVRYAFAVSCCAGGFLLGLLVEPFLKDRSPFLIFAVAVAASAIRGGFGPGLLAGFLGACGATYFFPPVGTFFVISPEYRSTAAFQILWFLALSFVLSLLGGETRRLRLQALELAKQRKQVLDGMSDGFVAVNRRGRIVYLNSAARELLGLPYFDITGKSIWDQVPEWHDDLVETKFREVWAGNGPFRFEFRSPSTNRWLEFHISGVENGLTASFSDVTNRKSAEQSLRDRLADRDAALRDVRLLRGILPICAGCKRIRDEKGDWRQLEVYISSHSQAEFSHGLCPECVKEYFAM